MNQALLAAEAAIEAYARHHVTTNAAALERDQRSAVPGMDEADRLRALSVRARRYGPSVVALWDEMKSTEYLLREVESIHARADYFAAAPFTWARAASTASADRLCAIEFELRRRGVWTETVRQRMAAE